MLKIITEPHPLLHKKAEPVIKISSVTKKLVEEMRQTMHKSNGIGLAAPQVGQLLQVAIVEIPADAKEGEENLAVPFTVFINPKITWASRETNSAYEGCLSIPELEVKVTRPTRISVDYLDIEGYKQSLAADELFARAIQHEIDHLNGILITDHGKARKIKE